MIPRGVSSPAERDDRSSLIEESGSRGIPGHWRQRRLARTWGTISRCPAGDSRDSPREGSFLGRTSTRGGRESSRDPGPDKADRSSEIGTLEPVVLLSRGVLQRALDSVGTPKVSVSVLTMAMVVMVRMVVQQSLDVE